MSETKNVPPQPPEPPQIQRRLIFPRYQIVGMLIILTIPVLALFNILGGDQEEIRIASETWQVDITYPTRFRYQSGDTIEMGLTNVSPHTIHNVRVAFDRDYVERFQGVSFIPGAQTITQSAYIVSLNDIAPQETRRILVEVQAQDPWLHRGDVIIRAENTRPLTATLSTFIFP